MMNQQELKNILDLHRKWVLNEEGGRRAYLQGADLRGANLRGAKLQDADLEEIIEDFYEVLSIAKHEVIGLYDALFRGKIDGSVYEGECACLVGTIAKIRGEKFRELGIDLKLNSDRPIERWFLAIRKGDTPENNIIARLTAEWMREWMKRENIQIPEYRFISSLEMPELFTEKVIPDGLE